MRVWRREQSLPVKGKVSSIPRFGLHLSLKIAMPCTFEFEFKLSTWLTLPSPSRSIMPTTHAATSLVLGTRGTSRMLTWPNSGHSMALPDAARWHISCKGGRGGGG